MRAISLLAVVLPLLGTSVRAQEIQLPSLIASGLDIYKAKGVEAAVEVWMKGSAVTTDESAKGSTIAGFHRVEQAYGRMIGYDALLIVPFGPHVRRAYVAILYERGPAYVWFDVYTAGDTTVLTGFLFNTKPDMILPPSFFERH